MKYLIFENEMNLTDFLQKVHTKSEGKIDYGVFNEFNKNRILFTASHAQTSNIKTPGYGKGAYVKLGDKNTDKLAIIMARRINSAFIIPRFSRLEADPCRSMNTLGKNEKILIRIYGLPDKKEKIHFKIHRNKDFEPLLLKYHSLIEKMNPSSIISVHGMGKLRHPPDILLGFGEGYRIIGGKKKALEFKKLFIKKVKEALAQYKIKNKLKINISKQLFTGEKNYVISRHVTKDKFGMHVEFSSRGRVIKKGFIRKDYQIAAQVLADTILEWLETGKRKY